jgi:hypothetical protein
MPENLSTQPDEGFTFVDKRSTADPVTDSKSSDFASEVGETEDPEFPEDVLESEDAAPSHSIYELAAYCTGMLINEGFQRLGLIADPQTGKATLDLPSARVAIDCVAALVQVIDEPSSTLPEPVRREVKRTLNDLRLNYIERNRV